MNSTTLLALAAYPEQLEHFYRAVPREYSHWRPASWAGCPSEHFTALEQVCHVRDIEIDCYHAGLQRMLKEERPTLKAFDSQVLVRERNYAQAQPKEVLAAIRAARKETVALIASLGAQQLARPGAFEGIGDLTVRGLVHYLCSHDQQYLAGLQWMLGKIQAEVVPV